MKKRLLNVEELRESLKSSRNSKVDRSDYFRLLVAHDTDTFTDRVSYNVWTEFHSKRGDTIEIKSDYLKQLLETYDEKIKDY